MSARVLRHAAVVMVAAVVILAARSSLAADLPDPVPSAADALNGLPSFGWAFVRMLVTLGAILLALLVVLLVVKRRSSGVPRSGAGRMVRVIEVLRLEPKKLIYLIEVGGKYLLVGSSEGNLDLLAGGSLPQEHLAELFHSRESESQSSEGGQSPSRTFASRLLHIRKQTDLQS